jgi:prolyl 4-hydroxylase
VETATEFTIPVEGEGANENSLGNNTAEKENMDDADNHSDEQDEDDPLAGKYFPPMYEAQEISLSPLANSKSPEKLKKIQIDTANPDNVFVIENVLTPEECQWLIDRGESRGFEVATVYSAEEDNNVVRKDIRDNWRVLEKFPALAKVLFDLVKPHLPPVVDGKKVVGFYYLFRYYRYFVGNNFAPHVDHTVYADELDGTESRYTFLIYLNDGFKGGETAFPKLNKKVEPKKGMALAFRHNNEHAGLTVLEGVKYLVRTDLMYK